MTRNLDYWKLKLEAARKEVKDLTRKLGPTPAAPMAVFICGPRLKGKKRWLKHLASLQTRREIRDRIAMLNSTKIPYYEERIASRTSRTSFHAVQNPMV